MWRFCLQEQLDHRTRRALGSVLDDEADFSAAISAVWPFLEARGESKADLISAIFGSLLQRTYSDKFTMEFIPLIRSPQFECACCRAHFARHLQMQPCGHKLCEKCLFSEGITETVCFCGTEIASVETDQETIGQQLHTFVRCCTFGVGRRQVTEVLIRTQISLSPGEGRVLRLFNEGRLDVALLNAFRGINSYEKAVEFYSSWENVANERLDISRSRIQRVPAEEKSCCWIGQFKSMESHQLNECSNRVVRCPFPNCESKITALQLPEHTEICLSRPLRCQLCGKAGTAGEQEGHSHLCLTALSQLFSTGEPSPSGCEFDYALELKCAELESSLEKLVCAAIKWDMEGHQATVNSVEEFEPAPPRQILGQRAVKRLQFMYETHVSLFCVATTLFILISLDIAVQLLPFAHRYVALALWVMEAANICAFLVYVWHYVVSNKFRSRLVGFMCHAFIVSIVYAATFFTALSYADRSSMSRSGNKAFMTFGNMLYFTASAGSQIGLGDVTATSYLARFTVVILLWFTQLTCKVVFRGISFFNKIRELEKMVDLYHNTEEIHTLPLSQ